jgi:hypothetical protein
MTTKDAYWFTHDSNAKDDPKVVMMIEQLGLESYGIFWVLIETLRDQPEFRYPLALIPAIARRYNTTAEKVKATIMNYGLFDIEDDTFFFSHSLIKRMLPHIEKKEQARLAAQIRWQKHKQLPENSGSNADAMRTHSDRNAIIGENSILENSIEEDKNKTSRTKFTPPTPEQVKEYCLKRKNNVNHQRWYDHYTSNGWMIGKNKMKDWQAAVRTWEQNTAGNTRASPDTASRVPEQDIPLGNINIPVKSFAL